MTFQPVIPISGYAGWLFLDRTVDTQRAAYNESPAVVRVTDNFRDKISGIKTAEDLVNNRQLLSVALGAFGLDDDINSSFFIRKVLEGGTTDSAALANKLSDTRYSDLSEAFGFGDVGPARTGLPSFSEEIIERYEARQFEKAVGEQNNDMRLALNLSPALNDLVAGNGSNNGQWFGMMGNAPLRTMFQTALGFPPSFATVDIDKQLEQFKSRAQATFGTDEIADLATPENQEKMIRLYMVRSDINSSSGTSSSSIALTLLQQI